MKRLRSSSRRQRQTRVSTILAMLMVILIGLPVLAACGLLEDTSNGGTSTSPPLTTATAESAPPTASPRPDWYPYVETDAGFRIDVPGILSPQHSQYINNTSGELTSWSYVGGSTSSALQRTMLQTTVITAYSTQITDHNLCHAPSATPITLGSGIAGWQETDVPPNPSGEAEIYGYARANLVLHGEAIQITLEAPAPVDTFFTRYGAIWRHMLVSFAGLPNQLPATTHPCY